LGGDGTTLVIWHACILLLSHTTCHMTCMYPPPQSHHLSHQCTCARGRGRTWRFQCGPCHLSPRLLRWMRWIYMTKETCKETYYMTKETYYERMIILLVFYAGCGEYLVYCSGLVWCSGLVNKSSSSSSSTLDAVNIYICIYIYLYICI
jgi:hypothetical protein